MAALLGQPPSIGDLLAGRYRLGVQIGLGGTGRVFRARDTLLGRDVAVKVLHRGLAAKGDADGTYLEEARAAARLTHPNVARILDTGVHRDAGFIVMELVEGGVLADVLSELGRLRTDRAVEIAADLADALDYAHGQGIVHCDVKPQNVLLTRDGVPKLVDFGVARAIRDRPGGSPISPRGTAAYIAPEQVLGRSVDGRADLYALGAVLYEMLAGRPPFVGESFAVVVSQRLVADPAPLRNFRPRLRRGLTDVVARALARDPEQRFQTGGQLRRALLEAREQPGWRSGAVLAARRLGEGALSALLTANRRGIRLLRRGWHAVCNLSGRPRGPVR